MEKIRKSILKSLFKNVSIIIFLLMITVTGVTTWTLYWQSMNDYTEKGHAIAQGIKDVSVDILLNKDISALQTLLNQHTNIKGVAYVIIRNAEKEIVAHTLVPGVPFEIQHLNTDKKHIRKIKVENQTVIDIVEPLLLGAVGYVHVGMEVQSIYRSIGLIELEIISIFIVICLISMIFIHRGLRQTIQPLYELREYTDELASHDFKKPLEKQKELANAAAENQNEIGIVASAIVRLENKLIKYIESLKLETSKKERLENELDIASVIQQDMLPHPHYGQGVSIEGVMIPAKNIGGDFYEHFQNEEGKMVVLIGDVSGKGVSAALFSAKAMTIVKSVASQYSSPSDIMNHVNKQLYERNNNVMFVTLFLGILDLHSGQLTYVNAGHLSPFLRGKDTLKVLPLTQGMACGVDENFYYQENCISLTPNQQLILYTDGITEAENDKGEQYNELFQAHLENKNTLHLNTLKQQVLDDIHQFTKGVPQSDDLTMLCIEWIPQTLHMKKELKVHFRNELSEIKKLQKVVDIFTIGNQIEPQIQMNINLILEELLTNIIQYGYSDKESHRIHVYFKASNTEILLKIEDDGDEFNPKNQKVANVEAPLEERGIGGLGTYLIQQLATTHTYNRVNNTNENEIILKREHKG